MPTSKKIPLVAIITRTKDRPLFLDRAIKSVQSQTMGDLIQIIVNDGGDKKQVDKVVEDNKKLINGRIKVIHINESNMETASNIAIKNSESKYIAILDDDDTWHPDFLKKTTEHLEATGSLGVVGSTDKIVEEVDGKSIKIISREPWQPQDKEISLYKQCLDNYALTVAFVYRRSVISTIGSYDDSMSAGADWDFAIRFLVHYDIDFIEHEPGLANYHHRLQAGGSAANSVFDPRYKREHALNILRNKYLRQEVKDGKFGIGYIMNDLKYRREEIEALENRHKEEFSRIENHMTDIGNDTKLHLERTIYRALETSTVKGLTTRVVRKAKKTASLPSRYGRGPKKGKGIYFFLGNVTSHLTHAMPLYQEVGGEVIVLSKKAYDVCQKAGVRARMLDDIPEGFLLFEENQLIGSINFLNRNAKAVIFYDLFSISKYLNGPTQIYLTHGNSFKYFYQPWRQELLKYIDRVAALGPTYKKMLIKSGVEQKQLVDVGIARWDMIIKDAGRTRAKPAVCRALGWDSAKPLIAYLPTWYGPSSIYSFGQKFLREVPDKYNVIFRPHPDTPPEIMAEYDEIIKGRHNLRYVPEGKYEGVGLLEIFSASELFIGGMSSVMLDVILTHKPMIFAFDEGYHRPEEGTFDPMKEIYDFSYKLDPKTVGHAGETISKSLAKGFDEKVWRKSEERVFYGLSGDNVDKLAELVHSCINGEDK